MADNLAQNLSLRTYDSIDGGYEDISPRGGAQISAAPPPHYISRIMHFEELNCQFGHEWDDLEKKAVEPNCFYSRWAMAASLPHFDITKKIRFFTLWLYENADPEDAKLCALVPIEPMYQYGKYPIIHWQNWLHHNIFAGSPLVLEDATEAFWEAILKKFDRQMGLSLFLHINLMQSNGPLARALRAVSSRKGRHTAMVWQESRAMLIKGQTPENYYENVVRSKKRKELRRQANRLKELGECKFIRCDINDPLLVQNWIDDFLKIESAGWKGANGSALNTHPDSLAFFHDIIIKAAFEGKAELLSLTLKGEPIAMLVNLFSGEGCFSFKTTYDEQYYKYSPGVLLQIENLLLLNRDNFQWCDSCAVEGHPMIDSLWSDKRSMGRFSIAIGGPIKQAIFSLLRRVEDYKSGKAAPRFDIINQA
ncbi:hypothetical protein LPB140_10625 [Sphingorhabdus lutea]|uniref:BioF2-like acetyltransferase domain-containing protein n=1 Tax=Sphingorhabdus lutea TaxID=1913578 RepID=A0A1L3JDJ2_9SPHN|nr:GNAT family N-acetyltransferase [Sphingorhabdus lutea]APG63169.1 hypothetical protein LPB140_10625 [Sphingorhabdus lutea]